MRGEKGNVYRIENSGLWNKKASQEDEALRSIQKGEIKISLQKRKTHLEKVVGRRVLPLDGCGMVADKVLVGLGEMSASVETSING